MKNELEQKIIKAIYDNFDLSPKGIINKLQLRNPIYTETCNGGHFGRTYIDNDKKIECTWEKLDSIDIFKNI